MTEHTVSEPANPLAAHPHIRPPVGEADVYLKQARAAIEKIRDLGL